MEAGTRVAIVGAGTMGTRVALRCAAHGLHASLIARDPAKARALLEEAAEECEAPALADRVELVSGFDRVADAALVYEAIPEQLARKQELLVELEAFADDHVPFVSGTSTFFPDQVGFYLEFPKRVFVAHFVHPVTLVPLAEIAVPTEPDAAAQATFEAWLAATALEPIRLHAPLPGFIVNRLQFALLREALYIVESGGADAAAVDAVVRFGLGPRWTATGPIESVVLGNPATFADVARQVVPSLDARPAIPLLERPEGRFDGAGLDLAAARRARRRAYAAAATIARERAGEPSA
jgi:3-hydroxybutyryl-CoA dehydrogenase